MKFLLSMWKFLVKIFKPFLILYHFLWNLLKKLWSFIKKNWGEILGIVIVILVMIVGLIYMAKNIGFKDEKEQIRMYILYIGMFTTFGGAYLGAKISGQNAKKLYENDLKIRDIENHMSANIKVLNEITNSKKILEEVKNILEDSDYFYPHNLLKIWTDNSKVNESFKEIENEIINKASLSINIDFDNLLNQTVNLNNTVKGKLSDSGESYIIQFLDDDETLLTLGNWIYYQTQQNQEKLIVNVQKNGDTVLKEISIKEIFNKNKNIFADKHTTIYGEVIEWLNCYNNMEYKTKDDLKKVYKKVRN